MISLYINPSDAHKAEAAKKLETYNTQSITPMLEKRIKAPAISTAVS